MVTSLGKKERNFKLFEKSMHLFLAKGKAAALPPSLPILRGRCVWGQSLRGTFVGLTIVVEEVVPHEGGCFGRTHCEELDS